MHTNFQRITSTSPPPPKVNIINILHIQYQKKCVNFYDLRKIYFIKKVAMYQKYLIFTPINLKVNQINNKTIA